MTKPYFPFTPEEFRPLWEAHRSADVPLYEVMSRSQFRTHLARKNARRDIEACESFEEAKPILMFLAGSLTL